MILAVTPNPSLDRTLEIDELVRGEVLRASRAWVEPSGKGVNVARALAANGVRTTALLPCGGAEGAELARLLEDEGIDFEVVPIGSAVRSNISIVEPDGTVTKVNASGPELTADEVTALLDRAVVRAGSAAWVVASGSLPGGVGDDFYGELTDRLSGGSTRVAIDTSGVPLASALASGPDLVTPNLDELREVAGAPITTIGEAAEAAETMRTRGARGVLVSLGADGALLVNSHGVIHGEAPVDRVTSAVGAGDALLAGFLAAGGAGATALAEALAWAAAACRLPGSRMPRPDQIDRAGAVIHSTLVVNRRLDHQPPAVKVRRSPVSLGARASRL
jgi:1-phosphofructokinase